MNKNESMMTLQRAKVHDVKLYNDDNGYGLTACGIRVGPWDVTKSAQVTCLKCVRSKKGA